MAQHDLVALFWSEARSWLSPRRRWHKPSRGCVENRSLTFSDFLNGKTEAINPHLWTYKSCLMTRVQSIRDTWILVLWLSHSVCFGDDLKHSLLKWQAELAQMVYGLLWAQGEAVGVAWAPAKWMLQKGAWFVGAKGRAKAWGLDAMICWSVSPANGTFRSQASNDNGCFSVVCIFQSPPWGPFCYIIRPWSQVLWLKIFFVFFHAVPNSSQWSFFLTPLGLSSWWLLLPIKAIKLSLAIFKLTFYEWHRMPGTKLSLLKAVTHLIPAATPEYSFRVKIGLWLYFDAQIALVKLKFCLVNQFICFGGFLEGCYSEEILVPNCSFINSCTNMIF